MDVDPIEEVEMSYHGETSSSSRGHRAVIVDDAHPFDLETFISGYSGEPLR